MNLTSIGSGRYTYDCPHCAHRLTLTRADLGRSGPCPSCSYEVTIPQTQDDVRTTGEADSPIKSIRPYSPVKYVAPKSVSMQTHLVSMVGLLLFVGGIIGLVYFQWFFDVIAPTNYQTRALLGGDVVNMNLMLVRLNGIISSSVSVISGLIITATMSVGGRP